MRVEADHLEFKLRLYVQRREKAKNKSLLYLSCGVFALDMVL